MKFQIYLFIGFFVLFFNQPLESQVPLIESGAYIYEGTRPLEVQGYPAPCVVDWNNDQKKDLVVGQAKNGNVLLFLNLGTNMNPLFNGSVKLMSGGLPITTTTG